MQDSSECAGFSKTGSLCGQPPTRSFNLMLHRRGKRPDPTWEITKESIELLLNRAYELLQE